MVEVYGSSLEKEIKSAKSLGFSDEEIEAKLRKKKESSVSGGREATNKAHKGLWIGFQYVLLFIAFYISIVALNGILHYGIDRALPDAIGGIYPNSSWRKRLVKWYIAAIIVAYPVFASLFLLLKKQELANPAVRNIKSRKFLIYLTLVVSFLIAMVRLIISLYHLLDGSLTARVFAHLILTLAITTVIFVYWLREVRMDRRL